MPKPIWPAPTIPDALPPSFPAAAIAPMVALAITKPDAKPNKKHGIAIKVGWYHPIKLGSSNALVAMIEIKPPICDILSIPIR